MNTVQHLAAQQTGSTGVRSIGEPFDAIAPIYDRLFTDSVIGRAQREQVMVEVNRRFKAGDAVLELNCGTGEDALALARRGVTVRAYDASAAMIEVANQKRDACRFHENVRFGVLRNEDMDQIEGRFDGALSNFAGMNCCRDWAGIAEKLARLIRPGGHVLLCIMGRACAWEIVWFLMRGEWRRAFRRASRSQVARIGTESVDVYYSSVREARQAFSAGFTLREWRGIGVLVPPSYCEAGMQNRQNLLRRLSSMDCGIGHIPGIRCLGDHVLLDFVRRPV
jgi:ubiquinone/menaquinone biosynthesis C-methylase UbiE